MVPQSGVKENLLYFLPHNLKQKNLIVKLGKCLKKLWTKCREALEAKIIDWVITVFFYVFDKTMMFKIAQQNQTTES